MHNPKVLVTSAAGHTGAATVEELLKRGFPVRAFVRRLDHRAERLRRLGADIFVGDLFDLADLRRALVGVQRAYHCPPFAPNALYGTMLFALAAEEAKLEVLALMSAWNPHPSHPAIFQRELWIAQNAARWMPSVDIVHINPGLFAFPYFFGLQAVVHFGTLMLPFGDGLNAPPSNEDIGAVVAGVLAHPAEHVGRSYRPTGPALISPADAAAAMGRALDREVRYRDVPVRMFAKAAKVQGFTDFEIAHFRHFAEEVRGGTYAIGAPTDHFERICGRAPEDFDTIARRYFAQPELVRPGLGAGNAVGAAWTILRTMLARVPDFERWESEQDHPAPADPALAHDSEEWRATAEQQQLSLLGAMPSTPQRAERLA